jgi:hypothetical protein
MCWLIASQFLTSDFLPEWMGGSKWLSFVVFSVVRLRNHVLKCTSSLKMEVIHSSEILVTTRLDGITNQKTTVEICVL